MDEGLAAKTSSKTVAIDQTAALHWLNSGVIRLAASMLKKTLTFFAGAFLATSLVAIGAELREGHPDTYTVRAGDTLWSISAKFLKSPWNWPEVWQANPQIDNPHRIYPGDVINLVYIDGKAQLVADSGPRVRDLPLDEAIPPLPLSSIRPFLEDARIVSTEERKRLPYVVANEENSILGGGEGRLVYVRQIGDYQPGDRVRFARAGMIYREVPARYPWPSPDRKRTGTEFEHTFKITNRDVFRFVWRDWVYEHYSELLGYEYLQFGAGEVLVAGDPATVRIIGTAQEVRSGDVLFPVDSTPFDLEFYPQPPKSLPEGGRILAVSDTIYGNGRQEVVVINRGWREGVENGDVYGVFQPGVVVRDQVKHHKDDAFEFFKWKKKTHVQLPDEYAANVMVFKRFETVSYALVVEGVRPVRPGAYLKLPVE